MHGDDDRPETAAPAAPASAFYALAVEEATELAAGAALENVDAELALLRMRLSRHLRQHPEDYELMLKSVTVIVRTAQARYRMSPRQAEVLGASVTEALRKMNAALLGPADDEDV